MSQPFPTETIETLAIGFDSVLQLEVEKAVWRLEAARYEAAGTEAAAVQLRRILDDLKAGAAREGYALAAAVCDSACRVIDESAAGSGQQRSLREHLNTLRNIVIASLQGRRYGSLDAAAPVV